MPIDYNKYPPNWKTEIRPDILKRAKNCCEKCGVKNYATGQRDKNGIWHDENSIENMNSDVGFSLFGEYRPHIRIVLTIAHFDHDTKNNNYSNLFAWCQKCHNSHDVGFRKINRIKNKGQLQLV